MDVQVETEYLNRGYNHIAGVDEVGRGALAGPVVAAAVILPTAMPTHIPAGIQDSKMLTAKKRQELFFEIRHRAIDYSVGLASRQEIDMYNIRQATLLAMQRALHKIRVTPNLVLVDGREKIPTEIPQQSFVQGDKNIISIAAASIVAKVTRDHLMIQMHQHFPQYGFAKHMGYGTLQHRQALSQYGPCDEHRVTFRWRRVAYA